MTYRPRLAPSGVRDLFVCEWDAVFEGPMSLVPDGCVELMWLEGRGALVCGPEQRAWHAVHARPIVGAGVRLRPGTAAALLGVRVDELTDTRVAVADLWGAARGRRLDEQLGECADGQRGALLRNLLARGHDRPQRFSATVVGAVAGQTSVRDLAQDLALSERQLNRLSHQEFGYGLAKLRSILRLQRVMALALRRPGASIASLAADCGYADQAHLARDSAAIAGLTPRELLASSAPQWHGEGSVVGQWQNVELVANAC